MLIRSVIGPLAQSSTHGARTADSAAVSYSAASVDASSRGTASSLRQNWILDPLQDGVLVIAAPLLVLLAALVMFRWLGAEAATSMIIVAHIVFTVAHHLPTFIRIYGDVDLFRRFKWNFVLAPIVPLVFCIGVLAYINHHDYPVEYFLYLYLMLALWDPWHFLRQHYGFMRIYDRPNAAPRNVAARMDLLLCVAWFVFIMLASGAWLADFLEGLYESAHVPALLMLPQGAVTTTTQIAFAAAVAMTAVYGAYLVWCRHRGYFISGAKLALLTITFGAMYLAYTPNAWILKVAPGWSFKVGFAAIGIVHMTQYLAIVWRYNRTLAVRPERVRAGLFQRLHARGGWWVAGGYVLVCLAYGELVTTERSSTGLMSVLLTVGFISTLMHYYFDGFIWKMRHQQNRDTLVTETQPGTGDNKSSAIASWWSAGGAARPWQMLLRHALYFGVPMAVLTFGAVHVWAAPGTSYLQHMYEAQTLSQQGEAAAAQRAAEHAYAEMNEQAPVLSRIVELHPVANREAELAYLIYNQSFYGHVVLPTVTGKQPDASDVQAYRQAAANASDLLERAITRGAPLGHAGRERLTNDDAVRTLASWRRIAAGS
jgi:hypothetical protein